MTGSAAETSGAFRVSGWVHALGGVIERGKPLWLRLGDLETRCLQNHLRANRIKAPVYIAGLPRSGTTILLEALSRHVDVVTHQYRDYPPVYTPFWWNWLLRHIETRPPTPVERAHRDRIMVTPASPEAMEEVLWMAFFPDAHDPDASQVLDGRTDKPAFEAFYRAHVAKLLLARGGQRYVAKGNYNITRLQYIRKIFPDARFVIPIRRPVPQIASLIKQHELFCAGARADPRALDHLRRVGHFEFGLDRRPVNAGSADRAREVIELWRHGEEVRGWARYWAQLYGFVADQLEADPDLRAAALVVRYEDLCARPRATLLRVFDHAALAAGALADAWDDTIAAPAYYRPGFSDPELAAITQETRETAVRFGYRN